MARIIYIMGVAGSGKTTIGQSLALKLGLPFFDGDDFHPPANKAKMEAGIPLHDADRLPWLQAIHATAKTNAVLNGAVITCSALKEIYRVILSANIESIEWVYLEGDYQTIYDRLIKRADHYMPAGLLQSQYDILEIPKNAITISVDQSPSKQIELIMQQISLSELGIIGLGIMGKSLAMNFAAQSISVSIFNRHLSGKEENIALNLIKDNPILKDAKPFDQLAAFVQSLALPRKIILMVNAGKPVDELIDALQPLLSKGDIIIDCGNSHYLDTARRMNALAINGLHLIGAGVSGGEEGALKGPSIMPGGKKEIYLQVEHLLTAISAKSADGNACCNYIGEDGAGHFVKMVHNGIEYAEMQLLAELYFIMRNGLGKQPDEIAGIFRQWNTGFLKSYLLEITIEILQKKKGQDWVIDDILNVALSKGTGSWATQTAALLGTPADMLTAALFARYQSAEEKNTQLQSSSDHTFSKKQLDTLIASEFVDELLQQIANAYHLARIVNHHQGFSMIKDACKTYHWDIDLQNLAAIWTNGCIIRSNFMEQLALMPLNKFALLNLPDLQNAIKDHKLALANLTAASMINGMAIPVFSTALNYLNAYGSKDSPMNLIQAQRDYFGAHGVILKSDPDQKQIHINWK